jgi:hypothetical protein
MSQGMAPQYNGPHLKVVFLLAGFCSVASLLQFSFAQVPDEAVTWETLRDPNGLFTIEYPSNWIPMRALEPLGPIDMEFWFYGDNPESYASFFLVKYENESQYLNSRGALQAEVASNKDTYVDYVVKQDIECNKYLIDNVPACSMIDSSQTEDGNLSVSRLTIDAVDETSSEEFEIYYTATPDLFEHFLPIADYMTKSVKLISQDIAEQDLQTEGDSPLENETSTLEDSSTTTQDGVQRKAGDMRARMGLPDIQMGVEPPKS